MKRLWVRPQFRGRGLGLKLTQTLLDYARKKGYTAAYLDTIPAAMQTAHRIYRTLGFELVEQYGTNPVLGPNPALEVKCYRYSLSHSNDRLEP